MMGKTALTALAFVAAIILVAGCIQPVQKLGCCLKTYKKGGNTYNIDAGKYTSPSLGNAWLDVVAGDQAYGCMLYNMSDVEGSMANKYDYTGARTIGRCNSEAEGTGAMCNVSIPAGTGAKNFLIPICTENDIIKCISGNCTAMVCGDFKFTPRVSPGFPATAPEQDANAANTKAELAGGVSTQTTDVAVQFYKGQCRFLPMDAKLRNIMKNSKSQINVFRMGVGGSFDEFDQYRYYFPISDQFCVANPGGSVDRYMNYLTADESGAPVAYDDPIAGITDNCVNGRNDPPVLAFGESASQRSATATVPVRKNWTFSYAPLVPDLTNYKFVDYARFDNASNPQAVSVYWSRSVYLEPMVNYGVLPKPCINSSAIDDTPTTYYGVVSHAFTGYTCKDEKTGAPCETAANGCVDPATPCYTGGTSGSFTYLCINSARDVCSGTSCIDMNTPCYANGPGYLCYGGGVDKTKPCARTTSSTGPTAALCISPGGAECTGNSCVNTGAFCAVGTTGPNSHLCVDASGNACSGGSCISTVPCAFNGSTYACVDKMSGAFCPKAGCTDPATPCAYTDPRARCIAPNGAECPGTGNNCINTNLPCFASVTTGPAASRYLCIDPGGKTCAGNCYPNGTDPNGYTCTGSTASCYSPSSPCAFTTSSYICVNAITAMVCPKTGCIDASSPCAYSNGTALCLDSRGGVCTTISCIGTKPCAVSLTTGPAASRYICMGVDPKGVIRECSGSCMNNSKPCAFSTASYLCVKPDSSTCPASGCISSVPCTHSVPGAYLCINSAGRECTSTAPLFLPCGQMSTGHMSNGQQSTGHSSNGIQSRGHESTGHTSTGWETTGYQSTGYNSTGHKSTGHNSTGYAYSPCIDAFYQCALSDPKETCTQVWESRPGSYGSYWNTTCLNSVQSPQYVEGTCEYALDDCTDEVATYGTSLLPSALSSPSCMDNTLFGGSTRACQDYVQGTAYYYKYDKPTPVNVFKKMDTGYYRSELSIAHVNSIYNLAGAGTAQAPFECDAAGNDCFSGTCDTKTYNRVVMLTSSDPKNAREVVTDCSQFTDSAGINEVTCAPTESVTASGNDPPVRTYAGITIIPARMERYTSDYHNSPHEDPPFGVADLLEGTELDSQSHGDDYNYWKAFYTLGKMNAIGTPGGGTFLLPSPDRIYTTTSPWSVTNVTQVSWQPQVAYKDCADAPNVQYVNGDSTRTWWTQLYAPSGGEACTSDAECATGSRCTGGVCSAISIAPNTLVWCPNVTESTIGPPLGGTVFFGKTGKDGTSTVQYGGSTIIGYSLLSESDFKNTLLYKNCDLHPSDYDAITLSDPRDSQLTAPNGLLDAFEPYFEQRVKGLSTTLGTGKASAFSVVFSYTPWIATFEKGTHRTGNYLSGSATNTQYAKPNGDDGVAFTWLGDFLASPTAQSIRQHNPYDEEMDQTPGTTGSELDTATDPFGGAEYTDKNRKTSNGKGKAVYHTYNLAFSKYLILIKYDSTSGLLGKCAIDPTTYMPVTRTLGWCEPCTMSTLAFQNITASPTPYLPRYTAMLNKTGTDTYTAKNVQPICTSSIDMGNSPPTDNVTCFNPYITDMTDYSGISPGVNGAPRTIPDASIIKERLGNYMKSGIMPVLDLSDKSNWNLTNPMGNPGAPAPDYTKYDFQYLFGSMGAAVVIVDHVGSKAELDAPLSASENLPLLPASPAGPTRLDRIIKRSGIVRLKCPDCLTAVHVDSPSASGCDASNPSLPDTSRCLNKTLRALLADPEANFNIDLVTLDYPASDHPPPAALTDPLEKAKAVVDDIASYGRASLKAGGKPVMVVGFNVASGDPEWQGDYATLFDALSFNQAELVQSGVIGVIYSPARAIAGAKSGKPFFCTASPVQPGYEQAVAIVQRSLGIQACQSGISGCSAFMTLHVCDGTPCADTTTLPNFRTWQALYPELGITECSASATDCHTNSYLRNIQLRRCPLPATAGAGLVDSTTGVGVKTDKFCDFEDAMQKMSSSVPVAIFNRVLAQDVECTACSSLDYAGGLCDDTNPEPQLQCDDGNPCKVTDPLSGKASVPAGNAAKGLRCPAGAVTADCTPCTARAGRFTCTYFYTNGTTQNMRGEIPQLSSDAYSDIIAALPKPNKCCLDAGGSKYSYSKQTYVVPLNKPLAFPKTGDAQADCGMGLGVDELLQAGSFCNYKLPIRQYDIECQVA